jgi:acyl carrier protein
MKGLLESLRAFVEENYLAEGDAGTLGPEDNLLQRGIMDSIAVLQVVNFLEEAYGITIEDTEITLENFTDLVSIAALVTRKTGASR